MANLNFGLQVYLFLCTCFTSRSNLYTSLIIGIHECKVSLSPLQAFTSLDKRPRGPHRYSDSPKIPEILQGIKAALKDVPNVDLLSPFRVHLVDFAETGLKINIVCYFATKSFDEFLYLQQLSLIEVTRVVQGAGATMTSVLYVDTTDPSPIPASKIQQALPQSATKSHTPREHDGLSTAFEVAEQEPLPIPKINGGLEKTNQPAGATGAPRPRGGSV